MPQYLVCNYLPDDFDPSAVTEAMIEEIHALNREMIAAGVRKFACGISPASNAKTVRKQPDGRVLVTDGAIHRDQGAHGRFLDPGSCRYGRGTRVGAQGRHLMRCGRRGARASFLPGSGGTNGIVSPAATFLTPGTTTIEAAPLAAVFGEWVGRTYPSGPASRIMQFPAAASPPSVLH